MVASESNEAIDHRRCLSMVTMVTLISKTNNAHHQRRQCIIGTHLLVLMICWLDVDEDVLTVYNHSRLAEWVVAVLMWQVTVKNSILSLSRAPRPVVAVIGVVGLREQTLTPQPSTPQPSTPQPLNPQPLNPQPLNPQPAILKPNSFQSSITASSKSDPASIGDRLSVARAISKSKQFTQPNMNMNGSSLVDRWIELARENERIPGQIDTLLKQLGDIPEEHTERALWIGALINPLPSLGQAMEIRPQLLVSKKAEERVEVALEAILRSIRHMDGSARMW